MLASAHTETTKEVDNVEANHRILEKQLKYKQWQLDDLKAMKDARLGECMITDFPHNIFFCDVIGV